MYTHKESVLKLLRFQQRFPGRCHQTIFQRLVMLCVKSVFKKQILNCAFLDEDKGKSCVFPPFSFNPSSRIGECKSQFKHIPVRGWRPFRAPWRETQDKTDEQMNYCEQHLIAALCNRCPVVHFCHSKSSSLGSTIHLYLIRKYWSQERQLHSSTTVN